MTGSASALPVDEIKAGVTTDYAACLADPVVDHIRRQDVLAIAVPGQKLALLAVGGFVNERGHAS